MSELGRLFRLSGFAQKPLENFATEALAIAIGHDPRPMKLALSNTDRTYEDDDECPGPMTFDSSTQIFSMTPKTQVVLYPHGDCRLGYLDLVLVIVDAGERTSTIWVEVKVDAWAGTDQICNYKRHAAALPSRPAIITLGRVRVTPNAPAMLWSHIVDAVDAVSRPHHTWLSLREFLLDEYIVQPPFRTEPLDDVACINVLAGINARVAHHWPGSPLVWHPGALRSVLASNFKTSAARHTGGGPLRYGLKPSDTGLKWFLAVGTKNAQHVRLQASSMLEDAEAGGLPTEWQRLTGRPEVLERLAPSEQFASHDDIVRWFDDALKQLRDARILDRYFAGLPSAPAREEIADVSSGEVDVESVETTTLLNAVQFAALKHRTQRRKGQDGSPYINHPIGVAQLVAGVGGITDIETLAAAILHDTIEDTDTTAADLEQQFGFAVAKLVEELTDDKSLAKDIRKEHQVDHAPHLSVRAKVIKLADKISNVRDVTSCPPTDWDLSRRMAYLDWTERVVAGCRGASPALERCYDQALAAGRAVLAVA